MQWIPVGKITRTHGLKGEFKFLPWVTETDISRILDRVKLETKEGGAVFLHCQSVRGSYNRRLIKFREINSVEEAKAYTGEILYAPAEDFPALPEGKYYRFQIEGLQAYDEEGNYYGKVEEIIETGSNDVYVVREGSREILLPMIESVVQTIDLKNRKLIFKKVEGLIEETPV